VGVGSSPPQAASTNVINNRLAAASTRTRFMLVPPHRV
jgi:hypothetical protein